MFALVMLLSVILQLIVQILFLISYLVWNIKNRMHCIVYFKKNYLQRTNMIKKDIKRK